MAAAFRDVEAATLALDGSPPITRITFPTCRAHYPGGSSGCACRLLPRSYSLPQMAGGSASALSLSRPAQASLTLRPAGLLNRLKAAFVTRLQPCRLPGRTARQLPDQSTTPWVESSSTSDPRLRGALPRCDIAPPYSMTSSSRASSVDRPARQNEQAKQQHDHAGQQHPDPRLLEPRAKPPNRPRLNGRRLLRPSRTLHDLLYLTGLELFRSRADAIWVS
jgi:hypothetical protein